MWISALFRRVFSSGAFGAIGRRGALEAGAIFIVRRDRNGLCDLYSPALQMDYDEAITDRRFSKELDAVEDSVVAARLEREKRLDSDFWVVEIEVSEEELAGFVELTKPS